MASTALVLGGGGITGIAWEIGVLTGLRRAGVDLTTADLVIGTSAGSVVGALVTTGVDLEEAARRQRDGAAEEPIVLDLPRLAEVFTAMGDEQADPARRRARIGAIALAAPTAPEETRVAAFERRLPHHDWPAGPTLLITGVDAETGEPVVWRRESGVPLVRAVAASCAVPAVFAPVTVNGRRYMDGGVRSGTNADLAEGADRVVVLAPLAGSAGGYGAVDEIETLRASGADVTVIAPDSAALAAFGPNVLDVRRRGPALEAGLAQGAALAPSLAAR